MAKDEKVVGEQELSRKGVSFKVKLLLALLLVLAGVGAYGYWWLTQTKALRRQAVQVAGQAVRYEELLQAIFEEQNRCQAFIAQKEGDFDSFEYCKKLLEWSASLPLGE